MKNKKLNYLLVPLVLTLWGVIIYKAISSFKGNNFDVPLDESISHIEINVDLPVDTFSLLANYRDPFKPVIKKKPKPAPKKNKKVVKPKKTQPEEPMPAFSYDGCIINKDKNEKIGIFNIGNKSYMMKESEELNGITIVQLSEKYVLIEWNNERKKVQIKPT